MAGINRSECYHAFNVTTYLKSANIRSSTIYWENTDHLKVIENWAEISPEKQQKYSDIVCHEGAPS